MTTYRIEKINSLLIKEVGEILLREIEFPEDVLVSVTHAEVTNDLKQANIFVSVLPFDRSKLVLRILEKNIYHLQQLLNRRLRMKSIPKISFKADPSIEETDKVEKLLKNE